MTISLMMKTIKLALAASLCLVSCVTKSEDARPSNRSLHGVTHDGAVADFYTYTTKLGKIQFVDRNGKGAALARKILLNGKVLLSVDGSVDQEGFPQEIMIDSFANPIDSAPVKGGLARHSDVNRMIVSIGPSGNCTRSYVVLDFTRPLPFVSKRFAYDSDGPSCEHLKKVTWGIKETYIDLTGPQRYLYRPYSEVIGPIDE